MIKNILTILFLFLTVPCFGATQQVMVFGTADANNTTTTEYMPLAPLNNVAWTSDETNQKTVWPASGTINNLRVELDTSPGAGNSFTHTIRVNGATPATPTQAVCTNTVNCSDTTNATTITAGDEVSFESIPTSGPSTGDVQWSVIWNPTTADETVLVGGTVANALATSGTQYLTAHAISVPQAASWDASTLVPTGGTFKSLYVELGTAPGAGTTRTFAFGTVDCTISETATVCNSAADTQAATAGQAYTLTSTVSGTPAASTVRYGIVFVPTTSGQFIFNYASSDNTPTSATEYNNIAAGVELIWTGTQTDRAVLANDFTMKNMYFEVEADLGPDTDTLTATFNIDASDTLMTCAVSGTGAGPWQCSDTRDIAVSDDQRLYIKIVPAGPPAASDSRFAFTGFLTPTGGAARRIIIIN